MTTVTSQVKSPYSGYSTELPFIDESLSSILHMAENGECALVSKKILAFWKSNRCTVPRNAVLQANFFQKLKIQPALMPPYIRCKLTPEMIRPIIDGHLIIPAHKRICKQQSICHIHAILNTIHQVENQKDWVSSYLLAHILFMSRIGHFVCLQDPISLSYVIVANIPFSSWLHVLQDPIKANCFIQRFRQSLPSFNLNFEGAVICASSVFNWYHPEHNNRYIQRHCLAILNDLAKKPEGKAAVLTAGGLKFLITILKDVFEKKQYSEDLQALHLTIELIHAIAPLSSASESEHLVMVTKLLQTIILSWTILQSQDTTDPKVQELESKTIEALQTLETLPEASYTPSSEKLYSSAADVRLTPHSDLENKQKSPTIPTVEPPQKPSKFSDTCCRII